MLSRGCQRVPPPLPCSRKCMTFLHKDAMGRLLSQVGHRRVLLQLPGARDPRNALVRLRCSDVVSFGEAYGTKSTTRMKLDEAAGAVDVAKLCSHCDVHERSRVCPAEDAHNKRILAAGRPCPR
mmetsp:Transcript_13516/g.38286  ORF Transcript_13516/g.38286 Transcript_13516/m.38286 type:complete len:124 (+) Transcript_13516:490-861(+)